MITDKSLGMEQSLSGHHNNVEPALLFEKNGMIKTGTLGVQWYDFRWLESQELGLRGWKLFHWCRNDIFVWWQVVLGVKNLPANAGDIRDASTIPGSGRSPGGGHGNPLQYSCLESPMDRGAWEATVHRVTKSWTWLKQLRMHAHKRKSNQSMIKEIDSEFSLEGGWSWNSNTLATWCEEPTHWKRSRCWERLRAGGEGSNRRWDGWMISLTQRTWVWANLGRWQRTGKSGMLQSIRWQRIGQYSVTEQQQWE